MAEVHLHWNCDDVVRVDGHPDLYGAMYPSEDNSDIVWRLDTKVPSMEEGKKLAKTILPDEPDLDWEMGSFCGYSHRRGSHDANGHMIDNVDFWVMDLWRPTTSREMARLELTCAILRVIEYRSKPVLDPVILNGASAQVYYLTLSQARKTAEAITALGQHFNELVYRLATHGSTDGTTMYGSFRGAADDTETHAAKFAAHVFAFNALCSARKEG